MHQNNHYIKPIAIIMKTSHILILAGAIVVTGIGAAFIMNPRYEMVSTPGLQTGAYKHDKWTGEATFTTPTQQRIIPDEKPRSGYTLDEIENILTTRDFSYVGGEQTKQMLLHDREILLQQKK